MYYVVSKIHFKEPSNSSFMRDIKQREIKKLLNTITMIVLDIYTETTNINSIEVTRFFTAEGFLF